MIQRVLAAAVLIAVIVAGWIVLDREQSYVMLATPPPAALPSPGYSARDAQIVETGPDGLPLYTLRASTITQLDDQLVALEQVRMQGKDDSGNLWNASADHGQILQDAALLDLEGNVVVQGLLSGSDQQAHVTTGRLAVDTHTDVVTTKDAVNIDWAGHKVRARGLFANLKDHRLRLESDVHGSYHP